MLLKRYKLKACVRLSNNKLAKLNFKRYKDSWDEELDYCRQICIHFTNHHCKFDTRIDCDFF